MEGYKFSKPTSSDMPPPTRPHLRKVPWLISPNSISNWGPYPKCSNTWLYGEYFSFKPPQTIFKYHIIFYERLSIFELLYLQKVRELVLSREPVATVLLCCPFTQRCHWQALLSQQYYLNQAFRIHLWSHFSETDPVIFPGPEGKTAQ